MPHNHYNDEILIFHKGGGYRSMQLKHTSDKNNATQYKFTNLFIIIFPIVIRKYRIENITSNSLRVKQNAFSDTKRANDD